MEPAELIIGMILMLVLIGFVIFLFMRVIKLERMVAVSIAEIKSKIGSVIREVNKVNNLEYKIDVNQQKDINRLKEQSYLF